MLKLRQKRAAEAISWREEAQETSLKSSGGQLQSADHPHRTNLDFQTKGPDQLEARFAHWGCTSFEQIAVSREAREWPIMIRYSGPSHSSSRQREWFISYEQGADQILQHYLRIKWDLFKQGWPDPLGRSAAFGIEDTISGLYHPIVKNAMYRARPPSMSTLEHTAVQRVTAERIALIHCTATHRMWRGLELENSPWTPHPRNRGQRRQVRASAWREPEQPACLAAPELARTYMGFQPLPGADSQPRAAQKPEEELPEDPEPELPLRAEGPRRRRRHSCHNPR